MSFFNKQELEEILNSGNFDLLIRKYENEWFDCKKEPYQLDNEKNKHELAKDISSFANIDGGYILIGAKTQGDESHSGEQIKEISTFEQNLVNIEQNQKIIESGIYPNVEGLSIIWYPSQEDKTKGLVLIKIPPQQESSKPFLTKKVLNGNKMLETNFGLFQRRGDNTSYFDFKDLHRLIQLGQQYEKNVQSRFDVLESMLQGVSDNSANQEDYKKKLEERREKLLIKNRQQQKRNLILIGIIEGNEQIKKLNFSNEIKKLPQHYTTPLREGGWKLLYSATQTINSPEMLEFGYDSNSLSLYSDGMVIYVRELEQISLINNLALIISIALIETIYQFTDFYRKFVDAYQGTIKRIVIRIELNNLNKDDIETKLAFDLRPNGYYEPHKNLQDSLEVSLDIDKNFRSENLAFEILKVIYESFDFEQNPPYTKVENNVGIVDAQQITNT